MAEPICPVCCEVLGENGGPTTLPCGHNGCVDCLAVVQGLNAECPLCRTKFDRRWPLALNTELRDLISTKQSQSQCQLDAVEQAAGWEVLPSSSYTVQQYSAELLGYPLEPDTMPSAPPFDSETDIDSIYPPQWVPDSTSDVCMSCSKPFIPLLRTRHHCRLCGRLFCHSCSDQRLLLPPNFPEKEPERVCVMCAGVLKPLQGVLYNRDPRADRLPVYDVYDWSVLRSWINSPFSNTMEQTLYQTTNILKTFKKMMNKFPGVVPDRVLDSVKGIVVLSEVKLAFGIWSYRLGSGVAVSRVGDDQWNRPCALKSFSLGAGLQIGGQLMDIVILLPTHQSIEALAGRAQICLSGVASAALGVGPGFAGLLSFKVGDGDGVQTGQGYGYSFGRGAFVGASLDGTVLTVRHSVNQAFYGANMEPRELLLESVPAPRGASHLVSQLESCFGPPSLPLPAIKQPSMIRE